MAYQKVSVEFGDDFNSVTCETKCGIPGLLAGHYAQIIGVVNPVGVRLSHPEGDENRGVVLAEPFIDGVTMEGKGVNVRYILDSWAGQRCQLCAGTLPRNAPRMTFKPDKDGENVFEVSYFG